MKPYKNLEEKHLKLLYFLDEQTFKCDLCKNMYFVSEKKVIDKPRYWICKKCFKLIKKTK